MICSLFSVTAFSTSALIIFSKQKERSRPIIWSCNDKVLENLNKTMQKNILSKTFQNCKIFNLVYGQTLFQNNSIPNNGLLTSLQLCLTIQTQSAITVRLDFPPKTCRLNVSTNDCSSFWAHTTNAAKRGLFLYMYTNRMLPQKILNHCMHTVDKQFLT